MTYGHDTQLNTNYNNPYKTRYQSRKGKRLIIFDWDDTLFPSSWLQQVDGLQFTHGMPLEEAITSKLTEEQHDMLRTIVHDISILISRAKEYGHVLILTNSRDGWVKIACQVFYQHNFLEGVEVISAQQWGNNATHFEPRYWKTNCLKDYLRHHHNITEIINFGDSEHDRATMYDLKEFNMSLCVKNVKFIEQPCVNSLKHQLIIIKNDLFQLIFNTNINSFINYDMDEFLKVYAQVG
jgi:hypothetical protein